ncbi:MAG TPA: BON domain-containing protein, partial [Isosphaeraceae bacterium]|nr:BON domain-containing protein [Isosphaeraceae bacterium]
MKRMHGAAALTMLTLSVGFWSVASRAQQEPQQEGVAAKAGEKLDEVGRAIKKGIVNAEETVRDGLNKTGESVREGFSKTRETVQGMGLVPRVYGRLHWDKALYSSTLFVKAEGGTVTIRGLVPDEAAKAKAVALAKDTVGVTRLIVQISVVSPSVGTTNSS